ncbi:hypothetical protein D3C81_1367700 [compost metagenome]
MPALVPKMLTALDLHDLLGRHFQGALDMRQRERISLTADFHHEAADHRKRQRHFQMEAAALAGLLGQLDRAAQVPHQMLHRVQANTAAGDFGHFVAHAEARQKQEGQ